MTTTRGISRLGAGILAAALTASLPTASARAADEHMAPHIERQHWTFGGLLGRFDANQLQRGFQVYKEVCASCHGLKRLSFRNLAEPGGPEFDADGMKNLAARDYKVLDGPNDQGKMYKRPAVLSDAIPSPFANEMEARAVNGGALPPDLSVMAKARSAEVERPFYAVPFGVLMDVTRGYQEGGADYVYALLNGYGNAPADMKMSPGMHFNTMYPGNQIAMVKPLSDGLVKYQDGSPAKVEQYARDVTAFLAWAADPKLEERKRIGLLVMLYLLITAVLLYFAKRRVWTQVPH